MTEDQAPILDFWGPLRKTTQSRIGLGRAGDSLPTKRVLEFKAAHAAARDAVHEPLDSETLASRVEGVGIGAPVVVASSVSNRREYLRSPNLGRQPDDLGFVTNSEQACLIEIFIGKQVHPVISGKFLLKRCIDPYKKVNLYNINDRRYFKCSFSFPFAALAVKDNG